MEMGKLRSVAIAIVVITAARDAPATIEEQRARLPPAAECSSPMAGRWRSLNFNEYEGAWYQFTLEIREDPRDSSLLTGEIFVDTWDGVATTAEPPVPCIRRSKGKMNGHGTFKHGEVFFGGSDYRRTEQVCGPTVGYNPDQFTGKLDTERQEFQAVNNDGGIMVNAPTVFRRIGCFEQDGRKSPDSDVTPPPFFPKRTSGC